MANKFFVCKQMTLDEWSSLSDDEKKFVDGEVIKNCFHKLSGNFNQNTNYIVNWVTRNDSDRNCREYITSGCKFISNGWNESSKEKTLGYSSLRKEELFTVLEKEYPNLPIRYCTKNKGDILERYLDKNNKHDLPYKDFVYFKESNLKEFTIVKSILS